MANKRTASVGLAEGRPDFRLKIYRDLVPDPPEHYATHQRRQFRQEAWNKLTSPEPSAGQQPKAKAKAGGLFAFGRQRQVDLRLDVAG